MDKTLIFFLTIGALIVWNAVLTFLIFRSSKKTKQFFETDKGNIYDLLVSSINYSKKVESHSNQIEKELSRIGEIIKNSFQKLAIVRYNPFKDTGGNQSFSLAILDLDNNGFIITSMHSRESSRVYAKPVYKGKSTHNLSAEEIEVLSEAVNKKGDVNVRKQQTR